MTEIYSIKTDDIQKLADYLQHNVQVYSPQKDEKGDLQWSEGEIPIDYSGNTSGSLKQFFFPQFEKIFVYKGKKGKINKISPAELNVEERVFWGVRPCDLQAILLMDKVFISEKYTDSRYKTKREKTALVSFFCEKPYDTCFCTSLNYDMINAGIADILFYKLDNDNYLVSLNPKGKDIFEQASVKFTIAGKSQLKLLADKNDEFRKLFKIQFELKQELGDKEKYFEDSYFEENAFKCIECGICTFICPTCHCFTIEDKMNKHDEGYRSSCWDNCQHKGFTQMAGGHNPRTTKGSRLRQRFLHKGFYFNERNSMPGCVGCGRCLLKCPVSMDICDGIKHVRDS